MMLSRTLPMPAAKSVPSAAWKHGKDHQVQQRCEPAEKQVGKPLIIFFDKALEFFHDVPVLHIAGRLHARPLGAVYAAPYTGYL